MSYFRVIPRDLFNEANLLKCLGKVYLNLEALRCDAYLSGPEAHERFDISQCSDDGSLRVDNVTLRVRGQDVELYRPLNARDDWPLWLRDSKGEDFPVFDIDGSFSVDMLHFLIRKA